VAAQLRVTLGGCPLQKLESYFLTCSKTFLKLFSSNKEAGRDFDRLLCYECGCGLVELGRFISAKDKALPLTLLGIKVLCAFCADINKNWL
jgi:hypothetical protein